jgi:hypothetical protein
VPGQLALSLAPKRRLPDGTTPPVHPSPRGLGRQKATQLVPNLNQGCRYPASEITLLNQTASPDDSRSNVNFSAKESNTRGCYALATMIAAKTKSHSEKLIDCGFVKFHWKSARFSRVIGFGKRPTAALLATGCLHKLVGNPDI